MGFDSIFQAVCGTTVVIAVFGFGLMFVFGATADARAARRKRLGRK